MLLYIKNAAAVFFLSGIQCGYDSYLTPEIVFFFLVCITMYMRFLRLLLIGSVHSIAVEEKGNTKHIKPIYIGIPWPGIKLRTRIIVDYII